MGVLHEECGVFGIFSLSRKDLAGSVYFGLHALQHRGQEGAGIVVNDDGVFTYRKDLGLVSEVFDQDALTKLGRRRQHRDRPRPLFDLGFQRPHQRPADSRQARQGRDGALP